MSDCDVLPEIQFFLVDDLFQHLCGGFDGFSAFLPGTAHIAGC